MSTLNAASSPKSLMSSELDRRHMRQSAMSETGRGDCPYEDSRLGELPVKTEGFYVFLHPFDMLCPQDTWSAKVKCDGPGVFGLSPAPTAVENMLQTVNVST